MARVIGYGRVSTSSQARKQAHRQRTNIEAFWEGDEVSFKMDACNGGIPLLARRFFPTRLEKAKRGYGSICVEHPDRLVKSYDADVIEQAFKLFRDADVVLISCLDTTWVHDAISNTLGSVRK